MATQFSVEDNRPWKAPFFTIWTGQAFSLLGSELVGFALIWYLTIQTGSATVLAITTLIMMLPTIFLGPIFGSFVDRWNRRRTMIAADSFVALVTLGLAALFYFDVVQVWHIYLASLLRAVGGTLHRPAMSASTSLMVPKEHLARIQGFNQFLNGGLGVIAAPLGAVLLDLMGVQGILMIDVFTAIIAVAPLLFVSVPQPDRKPKEVGEKDSVWVDMKEGFDYVRTWKGVMIILAMATLINFLLNPAASLMPLLVNQHFNGDALQFGWFNATFSIGIIAGSLLLGVWGGFKNKAVTAMVGIMGVGIGIAALGFLPSTMFSIALVFNVIAGLTIPLANGSIGAIMQASVAPDMQGRVSGLLGAASAAASPLGLLVAGPVADTFGVQLPFAVAGIFCFSMGVLGFMLPPLLNIEKDGAAKLAAHNAGVDVLAAD